MASNRVQHTLLSTRHATDPFGAADDLGMDQVPHVLVHSGTFWALVGPHLSCTVSETKKWPYFGLDSTRRKSRDFFSERFAHGKSALGIAFRAIWTETRPTFDW